MRTKILSSFGIIGIISLLLVTSSITISSIVVFNVYAADNFYNKGNEYRGFYWFEKEFNNEDKDDKKSKIDAARNLTPSDAKKRFEMRKKELQQARDKMLELAMSSAPKEALYESVYHYKKMEEKMYNASIALASAWEMVNFIHPQLVDNINNPVNVPANRVKRQREQEEQTKLIKEFANLYDLVLLSSSNCQYCIQFKPVLTNFANLYGFGLEITDIDIKDNGKNNERQKNMIAKIIKKFGIDAIPSVIAVSKDGKDAFEFARGFLTISGLERHTELASQMIREGFNETSNMMNGGRD